MKPKISIICFLILIFESVLSVSVETYNKRRVKRQGGQKLYSFTDNVELLDTSNFNAKVLHSNRSWLVEFYAAWCGDCQRFAPKWKALALNIPQWQPLVRLAVIDCSDEDNLDICRQYKIVRYPTIHYFPENSTGESIFFANDRQNHDNPQSHLLKTIINQLNLNHGRHFPDIRPYLQPNLNDLFTNSSEDINVGFLAIGSVDFNETAAEVALDLHKVKTVLRYAPKSNHELLKSLNLSENETPVLLSKEKNSSNVEIISHNINTRVDLKKQITNYLILKGIEVIEESFELDKNTTSDPVFEQKEETKAKLRTKLKQMGDVVFQADLEAALRYSLKQEVATTLAIEGKKLEALRGYIKLLAKYFPLGLDKKLFFGELNAALNNTESVSGREIGAIIEKAEHNGTQLFSTARVAFLGCQGSALHYRRYPCSLWKLFHYLTVNAALNNVGNRRADPKEVLGVMLGYVRHFFGCNACSAHFVAMAAERNMEGVGTLDDAVLWLWAAHNVVNGRLSGDATEDPEFPKMQFPVGVRCGRCRTKSGDWEEHEVLKYLKHVYAGPNVRYVGADTAVLFEGLDLL